jgi:DNA-binding beta-propeller fold protein YncE/PKD repeat protein
MRSRKRSCMLACASLAMPALMCAQVHHYEYVFPANHISVYDIDNGFALVKSTPVPFTSEPLGSVASAATGMLYLSHGSTSTSGGLLLKYDLVKDQVVWNRMYPFGIDSMAISPDGKTIYMPTGENNPGGLWEVIDATSGDVIGSIDSGGKGPHNTVITPDGRHVYMAGIGYPYLVEADAATHQILKRIGPVTGGPGVRPFTINGAETLAFMTVAGVVGFQVGDIATGKVLFTVPVDGFTCNCGSTAPSHGISLSPDETELYVIDDTHSYVHVFDITGLPGSAPTKVADIPLAHSPTSSGWLHHSRDGHYVYVGDSGDVIDTSTRAIVANLSNLNDTERDIEIDFQNGIPVWAMETRSSLGTVTGPPANVDSLTFHNDRQRTGWQPSETILTPQVVGSVNFGPIWNSPQFDKSGNLTPHAYASPLYVDRVTMSSGPYAGQTFSVVLAATSNDFVYAVNASFGPAQVPAGTILWSRSLGTPGGNTNSDLIPLGILGTPTVDTSVTPPRLYVVAVDHLAGHQAFALDITNGNILPGWPLAINNTSLSGINQNGLATFQPSNLVSQRGGLNLSPDGKILYVTFGGYVDSAPGWLVAIDTQLPAVVSAFSGAPSTVASADAGMWASSGVAIDNTGNVFSTTGNGSTNNETTPGYWGNSLLAWNPGVPFSLQGTYTPFNYCLMDSNDTDLAGGGAMLVPGLAATGTSTPNLVAFGGKQGNIYLVDRDHLPGGLALRPGCATDASLDLSLLPPDIQPQFGSRGPLNVFGPYSETSNDHDNGKARSTPAFWTGPDGTPYLLVTGSNKATIGSTESVPPGVYRLKIVTQPGQPAYLQVDGFENTLTLQTPGSPVITSNGSTNAIVWVLEANISRSKALNSASEPFLVALDALTLQKLYQSNSGDLFVGGKYNTPVIARGTVFVATDRIQAFGLKQVAPAQLLPAISSFTANPTGIASGKSATLSWATTGTVASLSIDQGVGTLTGTSKSVSPTTTTTYTLTASNSGGSATKTVTVTVAPLPPPVISAFTANPASLVSGKSVTLSWVTAGTVASLSIDQGVGTVTGTSKSVSPAITTTYTLTASNGGGSATQTATITVTPPPPPVISSFTANATSIVSGKSATLSWATTGTVASLSIDQGVGTVTGTSKSVSPITTTTYTLTASNGGGSATKTITVMVTMPSPPGLPVINSFSASPSQITAAQSSTLAWVLTGTVTSLTIDQGIGSVAGLSSKSVSPAANTTYTLTATNLVGSVTKSVTVQVALLPMAVVPFAMNACGPNVANFIAEVAAYTSGGNCTNIGSPSVVTTGVAKAAAPAVYQTKRTGQNGVGFTYTIPLPAPPVSGQLYTVRLHFADDLSTAAGQRVFNIAINGSVVLPNLDIFALTGQKMLALVKDVLDVTPNAKNQIVVQGLYAKSGQNPTINGMEVIPEPNGVYSPGSDTLFYLPLDGPTPIAPEACIVVGDPALVSITDRFGNASSAIHVGATGSPFDSFQIQCSNTKIASRANPSFTVGYWIRMSQLPNNGDCSIGCGYRTLTILSTNSDNGGCRKYVVTEIDNGGVPDGCQGGINGNIGQFLSTTSIVDSKWHNLLWVFDNLNKVLTLYIDGIQNGTAPLPDTPFSPSNTQYLAGAENGSFALNGDLDDFWIEAHAWSPAEVSAFLRQSTQDIR